MLRVEYENGCIVVGKFVTDKPVQSFSSNKKSQRNQFINAVLKANGFDLYVPSTHKYHKRNKEICEAIGPINQIYKQAHGISCKYMFNDIPKDVLRLFCFKFKDIDWHKVCKVRENLHIIKTAMEDGQKNITPIINTLSSDPHKLKQSLGKGLWKRLCKNSFSRNKQIFEGWIDGYNFKAAQARASLRSGLLHLSLNSGEEDIAQILNRELFGKYNKQYLCKQALHVVRDTKRLIGDKFNPKWSLDRIQQEHDIAVEERNKRYQRIEQTKQYEFPPHFPLSVEDGDYTAKLITTSDELYQEGKDMHHCVSMYHSNVAGGNYCVYSISKDGKKHSTVGYQVYNGRWVIDQHYMACNKQVDDTQAVVLADAICCSMNKD